MSVFVKEGLSVPRIAITLTTLLALTSYSSASGPSQTDDCGCAATASTCSDCCDGGGAHAHHGVCNMPPHYKYFPQSHGNYYFRPYNYRTILDQQRSVGRYGGDRRNPYDNTLFNTLYEQFENGAVEEELEIPEPRSGASLRRYRQTKPAPLIRGEVSHPPEVHIAPIAAEVTSPTSSNCACNAHFISDRE